MLKFFFHYGFICIKNYISVDENVLAKILGFKHDIVVYK